MLYEVEIPSPCQDIYEQHRYIEALFARVDANRFVDPKNPLRQRNHVWGEADGLLYVRRSVPTDGLPWRAVDVPPAGSMLNFQLKARCRNDSRAEVRRPLRDPGDCLAWLERNASHMGLRIEDAEVEEVVARIEKKTNIRDGFTVIASYFEGIAQVMNQRLFEQALARGCGDSKAFGFGFMFYWKRGQHNAA